MVAEALLQIDADGVVREWARDHVPSVARRVFFAPNAAAADPQIAVHYIAGPQAACLYQFDVWGISRLQAVTAALELANAAETLVRYEHAGAVIHGAALQGKPDSEQPDEESDKPRAIVQVLFTVTADGLSEDAS